MKTKQLVSTEDSKTENKLEKIMLGIENKGGEKDIMTNGTH